MIKEAYVSFEIAKLLEEKGFEILTDRVYDNQHKLDYQNVVCWQENRLPYISAPTLQMAMKWLREVHNIHIDICSNWDIIHWIYQVFVITPRTSRNSYVDKILYTSYEKAVEAGIKYALENLI